MASMHANSQRTRASDSKNKTASRLKANLTLSVYAWIDLQSNYLSMKSLTATTKAITPATTIIYSN